MPGENISALRTALATFGISTKNPCDLTALGDQVTDKTESLIKETQETLNEVAGKATGPQFWPVMASILGEVLSVGTGLAIAYTDKLVGEFVAKGVGTIYATLALAMTSVNGFQLIINYLAAIAVRNAASTRIEMGRIIEVDLRILLTFIQQLNRFLDVDPADNTAVNLVAARRELERAAVILGVELSKLTSREAYGVSKSQTERAIQHIEECLNLMSSGGFGAGSTALDQAAQESYPDVAKKLKMGSGGPGDDFTQIQNFTKFATALNGAVTNELWQGLSRQVLGADNYEAATSAQITVLDTYLTKVFPVLPAFARLLLVQELVGSSIHRLTTRIPLAAGLLSEGTKWLQDRLTPDLGEISTYLPPQSSFMNEPALLKQDPKLTWKRTITAVQVAETALLLSPTYFDFLKEVAGIAALILRPALAIIQEVKADMKDATNSLRAGTMGVGGTIGRKAVWSVKLIQAKSLLASLTPTTARGDSDSAGLDISRTLELEKRAEVSLEQLKELIKSQNLNDDGTSRTLPGEEAYDVAQQYLVPLVASQAILLHRGVAARILSGTIAVRTLITSQRNEDADLVDYCNRFIANVEALPNFSMLKNTYDDLLKSIGLDTSLGGIASDLMNGNLGGLADALDGIAAVNELTNLAQCAGTLDKPDLVVKIDPLESVWPDNNISYTKWKADKDRAVTDLKDKKISLTEFIDLVGQFALAVAQEG